MKIISFGEAEGQLAQLLNEASAGEEVIIARVGQPDIQLVPRKKPRFIIGLLKGQFTVPPEFDDPLPDEVLDAFEAREN